MKKVVALQASLGEPCDFCGDPSDELIVYEFLTGQHEGGLERAYACRSCLGEEYRQKRLRAPWA